MWRVIDALIRILIFGVINNSARNRQLYGGKQQFDRKYALTPIHFINKRQWKIHVIINTMKLLVLDAGRGRNSRAGQRWSYLKIRLLARIAIATEFVAVLVVYGIPSKT
jgi:hypothetical protein